MLVENKNDEYKEESYDSSTNGLLTDAIQPDKDFTPKNFLRGSVPADRLRHESEAQHGGLAHWRHNTNQQRDYDDQVLHAGMGQPPRANTKLEAAAISYKTSPRSPGMGLEAENFQSFISGTYQIVLPVATNEPVQTSRNVQQAEFIPEIVKSPTPSETRTDLPLQTLAEVEICNYRRKKSVTFTNLLARASSF